MRQYIENLSVEDQKKVFAENQKLQNEVLDDMIDSEMYWIGEHLDEIRDSLSDWSIGTGERCYIRINDSKVFVFIDGMKNLQADYCILADKDEPKLSAAMDLLDARDNADYYSDEFYELEEKLNVAAQEIADIIAQYYQETLNFMFDSKTQKEYFTDFYIEERMDEESFYIEEGSYTLYEDVSYTKEYK